jgi:hexosaminidase
MKKILICLCFLLPAQILFSQDDIYLIPQPVSMTTCHTNFVLPKNLVIKTNSSSPEVINATGYQLRNASDQSGIITFNVNQQPEKLLGKEGYKLLVGPASITISANQPAGLFYGVQTLLQLFPKEILSSTPVKNIYWKIPCVQITDYPRFGWRGLLLDVVRHWFNKQQVKDFIDHMAAYKYNVLHMHLTDDQGWRNLLK